jgi:hypothetical protein
MVIERIDGREFSNGMKYAVVREPEKRFASRNDMVWIEKGQWCWAYDVRLTPLEDLVSKAVIHSVVPSLRDNDVDWQKRYKDELARRRKAEHRAAVANAQIEPTRQEIAKLHKEIKTLKGTLLFKDLNRQRDNLHSVKIALIEKVIHDDFLVDSE